MKRIENERLTREKLYQEYVEKERTHNDIANELGIGRTTVQRRLKEFGIPSRERWVKLDVEVLRQEYVEEKRSLGDIAGEFGTSSLRVRNLLVAAGIKIQPPGSTSQNPWKNENFFDHPNSDNAYVIGFIVADGHLTKEGTGFSMAQYSGNILEKMSAVMKGGDYQRDGNTLAFYGCPHAKEVLTQKYEIPRGNKSSIVCVPSIYLKEYRHLLPHFIRGYFDGDGCVQDLRAFSFASGSRKILEEINILLQEEVGLPKGHIGATGVRTKEGKPKYFRLCFSTALNVLLFAEYIYGHDFNVWGSTLFVDRKRARFIEIRKRWKGRDWINDQIRAGRQYREIAEELGIQRMMFTASLGRVSGILPDKLRNKDWLYDQFVVRGKSAAAIGNTLCEDVDVIWYWVRKFDLPSAKAQYWGQQSFIWEKI